jgi:hypothetical protein
MATSSSGSPNDGRAAGKSGAGGKKSKVLLRFRSQNHCGKSESPPLRSGELFQQTARAEAVAILPQRRSLARSDARSWIGSVNPQLHLRCNLKIQNTVGNAWDEIGC